MPSQPPFDIGQLIYHHLASRKAVEVGLEILTAVKAMGHGTKRWRGHRVADGLCPLGPTKKAHPARIVVISGVIGIAENPTNPPYKSVFLYGLSKTITGEAEEVFRHPHHDIVLFRYPNHLPALRDLFL